MKLTALTIAACLAATAASATEKECPRQGGGYMCPGNIYVDGSKASSSAEALAIATAKAEQQQGQAQGQQQGQVQVAEGGNAAAYNGGNSVNIEGAPKHTTSVGLGLNIGVDIPIGRGLQGQSCRETVLLAHQLGYHDIALQVLLECPHVRKLNLKANPGDKG